MHDTSAATAVHSCLKLMLLLVGCLLLASCAGGMVAQRAESELQWPPLPRPAKVRWVKEISSYRDAGIDRGFWARLADTLLGAHETKIGRPYGIFADDDERLFIVDVDLAIVHLLDVKNNTYKIIGGGEPQVFLTPIGITGNNEDFVYITDSEAGRVYRYSISSMELAPFVSGLQRPTGIAFNPFNGLLYVSETLGHRITVFDKNGVKRFSFGGRGDLPGKFNYQTDLSIDTHGTLYVTDPLNARIQVFSADGKVLRSFGSASDAVGDFMKPKGVAVDSSGMIYVCDSLRDAVQVYDAGNRFVMMVGERGQNPGNFWMPSGLFIDSNDTIYVGDTYNSRIQVFQRVHDAAPETLAPKLK